MKTNHTPGPWAVDNRPNQPANSRLFVVNPADTKMPVACLPWCSAEDWANAQLLAAAPDLLAAAIQSIQSLNHPVGYQEVEQVKKWLSEAISKATQPA